MGQPPRPCRRGTRGGMTVGVCPATILLMKKKKVHGVRSDVRSMRTAVRSAMIKEGMVRAFRPVTVPDARKVASKAACRGKVQFDD